MKRVDTGYITITTKALSSGIIITTTAILKETRAGKAEASATVISAITQAVAAAGTETISIKTGNSIKIRISKPPDL